MQVLLVRLGKNMRHDNEGDIRCFPSLIVMIPSCSTCVADLYGLTFSVFFRDKPSSNKLDAHSGFPSMHMLMPIC